MSQFSKSDYLWLAAFAAGEIKRAQAMSSDARCFAIQGAYRLSSALHDDNPRFDRNRFLEDCGLTIDSWLKLGYETANEERAKLADSKARVAQAAVKFTQT